MLPWAVDFHCVLLHMSLPRIVISLTRLLPSPLPALPPSHFQVEYPVEFSLTEAASKTRMSFTKRAFQRYRMRVNSWLSCPATGQAQETALGRLFAFGRVAVWAGDKRSAGYVIEEKYYRGGFHLTDFLGHDWPTFVAGHERYACKCLKSDCGGCVKTKMGSWL